MSRSFDQQSVSHNTDVGPTWARRSVTGERWVEVDNALRGIARRRAALDADEARWLREAQALKIWRPLGMTNAQDYMERILGYGPSTTTGSRSPAMASGSTCAPPSSRSRIPRLPPSIPRSSAPRQRTRWSDSAGSLRSRARRPMRPSMRSEPMPCSSESSAKRFGGVRSCTRSEVHCVAIQQAA